MDFNTTLLLTDDSDPAQALARVIVILLICAFGLIANIAVILSILILKEYKKSVTHWYVMQLCIAGFVLMLTLPFQVTQVLEGRWKYAEWMCKAKETVFYLNFYASILFLMVMSIDRYTAICLIFTDIFHTLRKKKSAFVISLCVWTIALLLTIPVMIFSSTNNRDCICTSVFPPQTDVDSFCIEQGFEDLDQCREFVALGGGNACNKNEGGIGSGSESGSGSDYYLNYGILEENNTNADDIGLQNVTSTDLSYTDYTSSDGNETFVNQTSTFPLGTINPDELLQQDCDYINEPPAWTAFIAFNFSVMFLLPLIIICIFYGLIAHHLETTKVRTANRIHNDRRRVTIMCASLVISFMICWTPFYAFHLAKLEGISASGNTCRILTAVGDILALLNSALNPYLYSCLGPGLARRWRTLKQAPTIQVLFTHKKKYESHDFNKEQANKHRRQSKESPKSRTTVLSTKATITRENESHT